MSFSQEPDFPQEKPKVSFMRKLGAGSLTLSILLHAILIAIGLVWVWRVTYEPERKVDFMPSAGGGGSPSVSAMQEKQRQSIATTAPRVAALDAEGAFVLPEPDLSSAMESLGALSSGGMSGGMGGSGSGGGFGSGHGRGIGSGMGIGTGGGGDANPFGLVDPNANALVGSFYDLKQSKDRKPTGINNEETKDFVREFTRTWNERYLEKYYKASRQLYQTKLYIPAMSAGEAPRAFNCENEVEPSRWVVVYRGLVSPPRTGRYRFVGAGDDMLVVRFNGKNVFDWGYSLGTVPIDTHLQIPYFSGREENREFDKLLRSSPMRPPVKTYQYDTTKNWNEKNLGLGAGAEFKAELGRAYPIEILISEVPGGLFCAALHIEEVGVEYGKSPSGSPAFPLFRLDSSLPAPTNEDNAPPYDPKGPVWKLVKGSGSKPGL